MRRVLLLVCLFSALLVACGGAPADTTVPDPPQATVIEPGSNAQIDKLVADLKATVPGVMEQQKIKAETIEQKAFQTEASLQEIHAFYEQQLLEKGWYRVQSMPGLQSNLLLDGYESGTTTLVVSAFDASQLGSAGTVVFTAKGSK